MKYFIVALILSSMVGATALLVVEFGMIAVAVPLAVLLINNHLIGKI